LLVFCVVHGLLQLTWIQSVDKDAGVGRLELIGDAGATAWHNWDGEGTDELDGPFMGADFWNA
jgi:hypothetical protein